MDFLRFSDVFLGFLVLSWVFVKIFKGIVGFLGFFLFFPSFS